MMKMGNMMTCGAQSITSSDQILIEQMIQMKNILQNSTYLKIRITS